MLHECFSDEIAIDFPSVSRVVDRMRDQFLGEGAEGADAGVVRAEVSLSPREAVDGHIVPIEVPVRLTCPHCGGRGETWTEPCLPCCGNGEALFHHPVRVAVPPGVADGACFRFRLRSRDALPVRVELHVAIRPAAI
ncbi:MAG TPA: hypothetical protein VEU08_10880 [Vicinamibacterales bacterium]|nr:hypothetical protein [Vicinamibacterales bacterium]